MKRILALVLACVIAVNMGAVAYGFDPAYEYEPEDGSTGYTTEDDWGGSEVSSTIGMVLTATCTITPTYCVTVTWDSMAFTYKSDGASEWDPESHTYEGGGDSYWTGGGEMGDSATSTITITNHSNVPVNVSCEYEAQNPGEYENGTEYNGVTVDFTEPLVSELDAGTLENLGDDDNGNQTTATVSVSGDPETSIEEGVVGTITITVDSY